MSINLPTPDLHQHDRVCRVAQPDGPQGVVDSVWSDGSVISAVIVWLDGGQSFELATNLVIAVDLNDLVQS